jgi:hypothetical protein
VLDQHPDGDLVREPDVLACQPAFGDLAAEHLDVLGDARRQPVAELLVGVEPFELVVRAGHLQRRPGDLRGTRQGGRRARVEQPRPAPHQRHEEQFGHRVQVEGQQRAVAVRGCPAGVGLVRGGPPVPAGDRHGNLQPVVQHGPRAHHGRPRVHQPAAGRIPLAFHAGQPDPVAVTRDVQRVRPADVGDPGAFGGSPDHSGSPGQPAPGRYRQVHLRSPPEHQLAAFGEPHDLARRGTYVCAHRASVGPAVPRRAPPDSGMALTAHSAVSSTWRGAGLCSGESLIGVGSVPEGGPVLA